MAPPTRIVMPRLDSGKPCPVPIRWICDVGHVHPSHRHAVKCNQRTRAKAEARAGKGTR